MGFINSTTATTAVLTAKLTPLGREQLVTNTNNLITKFALGDSDANYNTPHRLLTGEVPAISGTIGPNNTTSNSSSQWATIRFPLIINNLGGNFKSVDPASINVSSVVSKIGQSTISGTTDISLDKIDINETNADQLINLFLSFGLPYNGSRKNTYTGTTFANGGWKDTAISGLANDNIVVVGISNSNYGESLDGKEIKLELPTSASTYTIYSTFQSKGSSLTSEDVKYRDTASNTSHLGSAVSFLVSDDIMKPNGGDTSKSWGTGFGTTKPFSVNGKELYNLRTNSNLSKTADTVIGVAYLDKGLLVITEPTIVDAFDTLYSGNSATTATFNSISTEVVQNVTCVAGRGEFGSSSNPTWSQGDTVRISEVGLYNNNNQLIAYGKFDRHVLKTSDGFSAFGIKIII